MADSEAPKSFRDPLYATLAADVEKREGLPSGLLSSVITHGERSNADQVSEDGARTVAQIIPATRNAALKKWGIDAYLSPQNALEVAGKLLKDSLQRNDGDPLAAVREYHGGLDPKNWGPRTAAYVDRVAQGLQSAKTTALAGDFAKWLGANPAAPAATAPAAPATAKPLDAGFAQWLQTQRQSGPDAIPGPNGEQVVQPTPAPEPSGLEKAVGTGEAVLNATTGMTGGAVGMALGTGKGVLDSVMDGTFGTQQGVQNAEKTAAAGAQALTYQPRTDSGQAQAAAMGDVLQQTIPVAPLTGEMALAGRAAAAAKPAVADVARAGSAEAVQAIRDGAAKLLGREPEPAGPTPGTMGSMGAAGADIATVRRAAAQDLPVPVDLTKGQAERTFEQQRFEGEIAKDPNRGQALRDRFADQNAALIRNFDAFVDATGAQARDPVSVGDAVQGALRSRAAADKNQIRVAYKSAEKAGAMEAPVSLEGVVNYLNEAAPDAATAPLVNTARNWAVKLGIAELGPDGTLIPANTGRGDTLMNRPAGSGAVNLKTAETFRQAINRNTDFEPTNIRQSTIIKGLIDQATENKGGEPYRQARLLRTQYAQRYENFGLASDLINNKRGMSDAKVAAEDVFRKAILNSSMADVRQLGRLIKSSGEQGRQAWAEVQGAAVRHVQEQALKNVSRDTRGNPIVSPAGLDAAVTQLDRAGKLDYLFGKKGAEQMRAINDLAKVVLTVPPGAINTSNTASVILAAMDMATSGVAGFPVPVMSGLRILTTHVKDRQIQKRIREALGIKPEIKKAKAPQSVVPPSAQSTRVPENRTVQ